MRHKLLFIVAAVGILVAMGSAYVNNQRPPAQPPLFVPATNPYADGIYANGIVESSQSHGENINIYPDVAGQITGILVSEGQQVHRGDLLLTIDDSVQRAAAEQLLAQTQAAAAMLEELKAQPRPEVLAIASAQVELASASLKNAKDQLKKRQEAYEVSHGAVSLDEVDNARDAAGVAETSLEVAQRQFDLMKAGAWKYDVQNQEKQVLALTKSHEGSVAMLRKYTLVAPADGVIISVQAEIGSYVSSQGAYGSYTGGFGPLIVMTTDQDHLQVRCYVDEILVHRLPDPGAIEAQMFIRGTETRIPLTFERLQPYVSPKIELSNQRQERVDVRVLPVIFRFQKPTGVTLFPGQLVDVYIGQHASAAAGESPAASTGGASR